MQGNDIQPQRYKRRSDDKHEIYKGVFAHGLHFPARFGTVANVRCRQSSYG